MKTSILLSVLIILLHAHSIAQYCTPAVNSTGVYYNGVQFDLTGYTYGVTGGSNYYTASGGYTNTTGGSGTVKRNCAVGIPVSVYNPTGTTMSINMRVFIDYNNDLDFDDAGELAWDYDNTINTATSLGTTAGFTIVPALASSLRIRFAVREGGAKATACGGYTGEIEDYQLTDPANTAPAMMAAVSPFIDPILETQTNNVGLPVSQLIVSASPTQSVYSDADQCVVPGIALTGMSASNGQWQYKLEGGSWTNINTVNTSNALLLAGNTDKTRIRFLPTGAGMPSIVFKLWDQSSGSNGSYANTVPSGGATAFSISTKSVSMSVYSAASASSDVKMYMATTYSTTNLNNIRSFSFNPSTSLAKLPESITTDNANGFGYDIAFDNISNKLIWIGGSSGTDLMRCNLDGTGVQTLQAAMFNYATGVAFGGNKIFIADYSIGIYSANADGSGMGLITGGSGQAANIGTTADIEYNGGKIYYVNQPGYAGNFKIMKANADGTGTVELYSTSNTISGIDVPGNVLYWTELDVSNNAFIKSMPSTGGAVTTLTTEPSQSYTDVFADESNAVIYITAMDYPSGANSRMKTLPLSGGTPVRILDLEDMTSSVVFARQLSTLPVTFIGITAAPRQNAISVEWNIAQELGLSDYIVEHAPDGFTFTTLGSATASHHNQYSFLDQQPFAGNNYYRIKAMNIDGSFQYSKTVKVSLGNAQPLFSIYPTFVTKGQTSLRMENIPQGKYTLSIINSGGQLVHTRIINHNGGSSITPLTLPSLSRGTYRVSMKGGNDVYNSVIVVQ